VSCRVVSCRVVSLFPRSGTEWPICISHVLRYNVVDNTRREQLRSERVVRVKPRLRHIYSSNSVSLLPRLSSSIFRSKDKSRTGSGVLAPSTGAGSITGQLPAVTGRSATPRNRDTTRHRSGYSHWIWYNCLSLSAFSIRAYLAI